MYRQYEDPYKLEQTLKALEAELENTTDDIESMDLWLSIEEMKQRINFAWQDDEYNCGW